MVRTSGKGVMPNVQSSVRRSKGDVFPENCLVQEAYCNAKGESMKGKGIAAYSGESYHPFRGKVST